MSPDPRNRDDRADRRHDTYQAVDHPHRSHSLPPGQYSTIHGPRRRQGGECQKGLLPICPLGATIKTPWDSERGRRSWRRRLRECPHANAGRRRPPDGFARVTVASQGKGLGLPALLLVGCTGPDGQAVKPSGSTVVARDGGDRRGRGVGLTGVANAVPRSAGVTAPNVLSPELIEVVAAQGSIPVENRWCCRSAIRRCRSPTTATTATGRDPGARRRPDRDPPGRGDQDRARQEHLPGAARPGRRGPRLRLRHALHVPGPRERCAQGRHDHADQPRRRRHAPGDGDRTFLALLEKEGCLLKSNKNIQM